MFENITRSWYSILIYISCILSLSFLKKDEKTGKWYDVGDKKAAEKTSQALREKGPEKGEGSPGDGPTVPAAAAGASPAFLLPTPSVPPLDIAGALPAVKGEEKDGEKTEEKEEEKEGGDKEEIKAESAEAKPETVVV